MRLRGARVAITGASAGIGAEAALAFAREGCRLALCARRIHTLEQVAARAREAGAPEVRVAAVDVTRRADLDAWARDLGEAWEGGLEVAVANAGVGHYGPFLTMEDAHLEQLLDTDLLGVWRTTQALGPLLSRAKGHVLVVGSVAGKVPLPYLSTYCAAKAALVAWTRSARPELARAGIGLTLFDPGSTRTGFARRALREGGVRGESGVGGPERGMTAAQVAQALVRAARRRPREVDLTLEGKAGLALAAVAPHLLARAMERGMRPRRGTGGMGNWKR